MQTKNIEVGAEYAYTKHKSAMPMRVKVLETGVEHKVWSDYALVTKRDGVRVEFVDFDGDKTAVVKPRQIIELWADWEPKRDAQKAAAEARYQRKVSLADEHWARIKELDEFFASRGVEGKQTPVFPGLERVAAARVGFVFDDGVTVLHGVNRDGNVNHDVVDGLVRQIKEARA